MSEAVWETADTNVMLKSLNINTKKRIESGSLRLGVEPFISIKPMSKVKQRASPITTSPLASVWLTCGDSYGRPKFLNRSCCYSVNMFEASFLEKVKKMSEFEIGKSVGELAARVSMLEKRMGGVRNCKSEILPFALFGARVHNQTSGSITCWTGEPKPSTNNNNLFEVASGGTSPSDVDCDHVKDPSGQWWKCGEDVFGVRLVIVEPSGAVRNAECKTTSYNQPCSQFLETTDELVYFYSSVADRAKSLFTQGGNYEKGCSGFVSSALNIAWEDANSLMGNNPSYVGKDNSYTGLTIGDIVGWKVNGGSGHVAVYIGEAGMKFLDVRQENSTPRKVANGYGPQSVFKSARF